MFVTAEGVTLTPSIVDVASARLEKDFGMERASLVFLSAAGQPNADSAIAITDRLYSVARDALHHLAPARVAAAQALPGGSQRALSGPIRASYTSIDLGFTRAGNYPLQVIRFGRSLTVLATGGEPQVNVPNGLLILKNANGVSGVVDDPGGRIAEGLALLLNKKNY